MDDCWTFLKHHKQVDFLVVFFCFFFTEMCLKLLNRFPRKFGSDIHAQDKLYTLVIPYLSCSTIRSNY